MTPPAEKQNVIVQVACNARVQHECSDKHLRVLDSTSGIQLETHICTESQQHQEIFVYSSFSRVGFSAGDTNTDKCVQNLKEKIRKLCLLMNLMACVGPISLLLTKVMLHLKQASFLVCSIFILDLVLYWFGFFFCAKAFFLNTKDLPRTTQGIHF